MIAKLEDVNVINKSVLDAYNCQLFKNKRIVIFGCTIYAQHIKESVEKCGLYVDIIIDNNPQKIGKMCMDLCVRKPEDLCTEDVTELVVIVASKYHNEMISQLDGIGIDETQILDIEVSESVRKVDDSIDKLKSEIENRRRGYEIYKNIMDEYDSNTSMYICPYAGTGDVYMACGFLQEYLERENISQYVICLIGNNCKKVANLFGFSNAKVILEDESKAILEAWEFYGNEVMNVKPLLHRGWRTKRYIFTDNCPELSFADMFKYDVFGLTENVDFKPPVFKEYDVNEILNEDILEGKTVIIAPYANSFVSDISIKEWESLVEELINRGLVVFTNCYGDKEKPIKGTKPIQFSYEQAEAVLKYAGYFIAVRNGLCDIVSSVNCKKVVVYESGFNASNIDYFGLNKMELCNDAIEIMYQKERLVEDIIQRMME